jgi:alpha-beta hydrolase superfamily lysophospholipase
MSSRRLILALIAVPLLVIASLAGMVAFGTTAPPPPLASVYDNVRRMDVHDAPPLLRYTARDGAALAYRAYPATGDRVAVLVHGSTGSSLGMHLLARRLAAAGITAYALDMRGHGASGRRGDIDYIGQLDDDVADFVAAIKPRHPDARLALIGFSAGGGFTARFAGGAYGDLFDRYILLAPYLGPAAPTNQPGNGGWAVPYWPRIVAIAALNQAGVHWFDGLPVVAYAKRPDPDAPLPTYSWRLSANFRADTDYLGDFRRAGKPVTVIVGAADDEMIADRYEPAITAVRFDVVVTVLPGLGHIDMTAAPAALDAVVAALGSQVLGYQSDAANAVRPSR